MSITPLGPPELDDVVHELYPPDTRTLYSEPHRSALLAWAEVNELPIGHMPNRRITVNVGRRTIEYWVIWDAPQTAGARVLQAGDHGHRLERLPLVAEPAGILIGDQTCGHMRIRGPLPEPTLLRCNLEVNSRGQHAGDHADGLHDNAEWLNLHPGPLSYRGGRADVAGRPAVEQHALVLLALEERAALPHVGARTYAADVEGYAGRRGILERHAPRPVHVRPTQVRPLCERRCAVWPCPDYRDAAAGLVRGLENP